MEAPASKVQSVRPVSASSAYRRPSMEGRYTMPSTTAGAARTVPPVVLVQSTSPVLASAAYTLKSSEPKYTTPFDTVGEENTESPVDTDQPTASWSTLSGPMMFSESWTPTW